MLIASWLGDQFGSTILLLVLFLATAMHIARKFGNANPEVKETARTVAAAKVIEWIRRMMKK